MHVPDPATPASTTLGALPLHPRMRLVWTINYGLLYTFLLALVLVPLLTLTRVAPIAVSAALAVVLGSLAGWRYAVRYARAYSAAQLADGIMIRRGVWWRGEVFVPRARIQHTEINQGPLDRRWGMASVTIHTAGTRLEHIAIPGLTRELAEALRDALLDRKAHADGA